MRTTWRGRHDGLVAIGVAIATLSPSPLRAGPPAPPVHLSETGLYSEPATHRVDERNLRYSPQYPLWSDGAVKSRWIFLPPGDRRALADRGRRQDPRGAGQPMGIRSLFTESHWAKVCRPGWSARERATSRFAQ